MMATPSPNWCFFWGDSTALSTTLRYFFSTVFQGVAALLGVWGMFLLFLIEALERKNSRLDQLVRNSFRGDCLSPELRRLFALKGGKAVAQHMIQGLESSIQGAPSSPSTDRSKEQLGTYQKLVESYERIERAAAEAKKGIGSLLRSSLPLLAVSLICLYLTAWSPSFDCFLLLAAVGVLVWIVYLLQNIFRSTPRLIAAATSMLPAELVRLEELERQQC